MKIQLEIIKGSMQALANGQAVGTLENLGLIAEDIKLVTGGTAWQNAERHRITKTLDALQYGTMDLIGLPRFTVPAEYVAAVIAMFVHPANIMVACRWMESGQNSVSFMGDPSSTTNTEAISAGQLFALCLQSISQIDSQAFRKQFETRVNLAINKGERDGISKKVQRIETQR